MDEILNQLDSFDPVVRSSALEKAAGRLRSGQLVFPAPLPKVNLHCHTFFSYNCYGYSPSGFAFRAKQAGLAFAGIVDFDVLDGGQEFFDAARQFDLKAVVGMETRVFVPEFSDVVINSPGEPGIAYHTGIGFPMTGFSDGQKSFLDRLKRTAQDRNKILLERVNNYLKPLCVDYTDDVLPLTPAGNPTERHITIAFAKRAAAVYPDPRALASFWSEKLSMEIKPQQLPESIGLLNSIRSKLMKRPGPGYVEPDKGSFPRMAELNEFILSCGAIPVLTWLDGTSEGEGRIEEFIALVASTGVAAINIIPDRNYTPGVKDQKLRNLNDIIAIARQFDMPVIVGTEMNSPGQKFVDDFENAELAPFVPVFLKGAGIVYAHTVLQRRCSLGYTSAWAKENFGSVSQRNDFYESAGSMLCPAAEEMLSCFSRSSSPGQILETLRRKYQNQ